MFSPLNWTNPDLTVSRMTRDEARRQLLTNLQAHTRLEAAAKIKEIKDEAQRAADAEAFFIIDIDSVPAAATVPAVIPERFKKERRSMVAPSTAACTVDEFVPCFLTSFISSLQTILFH